MDANPTIRVGVVHHPEFQMFMKFWVTEFRCPMPLVDWLMEHDLDAAADCARYAATVPDRPVYCPMPPDEPTHPVGLFPIRNISKSPNHDAHWIFTHNGRWQSKRLVSTYADGVPPKNAPEFETVIMPGQGMVAAEGTTPTDAILDLMARWIVTAVPETPKPKTKRVRK